MASQSACAADSAREPSPAGETSPAGPVRTRLETTVVEAPVQQVASSARPARLPVPCLSSHCLWHRNPHVPRTVRANRPQPVNRLQPVQSAHDSKRQWWSHQCNKWPPVQGLHGFQCLACRLKACGIAARVCRGQCAHKPSPAGETTPAGEPTPARTALAMTVRESPKQPVASCARPAWLPMPWLTSQSMWHHSPRVPRTVRASRLQPVNRLQRRRKIFAAPSPLFSPPLSSH